MSINKTLLFLFLCQVFIIAGTDPTNFLHCMIHLAPGETALYVRGDDMPHFPGRLLVESLMPIRLLPYTVGVSSTQIRRESYPHLQDEDTDYLEMIN